MAARPDLAAFLVALGVDALSVSPRAIPELKQALAGFHVKPLAAAMDSIVASRNAGEAELAIRARLTAGDDANQASSPGAIR
jgi:phosphoenolpyruvate-protein kinase (PTS system EI component)